MNFNSPKFAAVVAVAKNAAANSPAWLRAVDKAAADLIAGRLIVTLLADGALVTSANGSYRVNGSCQCKAANSGHRECYHRAAARLIEMMEAPTTPRTPSRTVHSACWYGTRAGNAMYLHGWMV